MANNKEKIRELKNKIILANDALVEFLKNVKTERTDEEKEKDKSDFALMRATLSSLNGELKLTRMNKNMSEYFEFIPTPGLNRRQRKEKRKLRKNG